MRLMRCHPIPTDDETRKLLDGVLEYNTSEMTLAAVHSRLGFGQFPHSRLRR